MFWWRPIREYLAAIAAAYQSFVLGLVFGVAGAIGLFVSDQSGVRIAALIGVALGFIVAPYKAFQRMRWERDVARADSPFDRLAIELGYVKRALRWRLGDRQFRGAEHPRSRRSRARRERLSASPRR